MKNFFGAPVLNAASSRGGEWFLFHDLKNKLLLLIDWLQLFSLKWFFSATLYSNICGELVFVANLKVANLNGHAKFRIRGSLRYLVLNFAVLCYEVAIF